MSEATKPERFDDAIDVAERLRRNVETVVLGKDDAVTLVLAALACGGHVLLEDVPGTAKTVLARAIAASIEGAVGEPHPVHAGPAADRRHRPVDLEPADARLRVPCRPGLRERSARRRDEPGAAEGAVRPARGDGRAAGHRRRCDPQPAGPVPPDRDREPDRAGRARSRCPRRSSTVSSCARRSGYPSVDDELRILDDQLHGHPLRKLRPVVELDELDVLFTAVEDVYVDPLLKRWIVDLVRATRDLDIVQVGASVRGSLALERAARAWALAARQALRRCPRTSECSLRAGDRPPADALAGAGRREDLSRDEAVQRVFEACKERAPRPEPAGARRRARRKHERRRPRPFALVPRRRFLGVQFGRRRSSRRGLGDEVAGTRPYRPGDLIAHIHWAASARLSEARGTRRVRRARVLRRPSASRRARPRSPARHGDPRAAVAVARQARAPPRPRYA